MEKGLVWLVHTPGVFKVGFVDESVIKMVHLGRPKKLHRCLKHLHDYIQTSSTLCIVNHSYICYADIALGRMRHVGLGTFSHLHTYCCPIRWEIASSPFFSSLHPSPLALYPKRSYRPPSVVLEASPSNPTYPLTRTWTPQRYYTIAQKKPVSYHFTSLGCISA